MFLFLNIGFDQHFKAMPISRYANRGTLRWKDVLSRPHALPGTFLLIVLKYLVTIH